LDTIGNVISSVSTIIIFGISILFPIFISIFLNINKKDLKKKSFKSKYEALYDNLNVNYNASLLYYPLFMLRRFILTVIAITYIDAL
jgi:hypothetical protein